MGSRSDRATSDQPRGADETFGHFPLDGILRSIFEGGAEGRRRAVLLFSFIVGPTAVALTAVLSSHDRVTITAIRALSILVLPVWLMVRPNPSRPEWATMIALLVGANALAQVSAGPAHAGLFALNGLAVFAAICIAFESWLVVFTGVLYTSAYTAVQLHLYSTGVALAAALMFAIIILLMGILIHGTAFYLRTALRREQLLHVRMERAAEQERARIAGELHDDTIQVLTATALRLDDVGRRLQVEGSANADSVKGIRALLGQALERTRRLTFELYPAKLEQRGLEPSLQALADQVSADAPFQVQLAVRADGLPGPVAQLAYRTIKELLTNASKHADATRVDVWVTAQNGLLAAEVSDDGVGFENERLVDARRGLHLGLEATRDRVQAAGGTFDIASAPGRGTTASFTLPLEAA